MRAKRTKTKQKGFVVVVVLSMVSMLAVLLLGFNYKSRASLLAVEDFQNSQQALNCARAGLNIAIAAIRNTEDIGTNKKLLELLSGETIFAVGEGSCSVTITEENGKLNVNLLKDKDGRLNQAGIDQLLRLIDLLNRRPSGGGLSHIGYGLVPAIIDWTDSDDEVTCLPFITQENLGAESDYYMDLASPYQCKNKSLDTTEELLLVKGVTTEVFERIRDYVTVKGDGKVNINAASKPVIESLSEKMDAALAEMVIDRRKIKPFDSIVELRDVPGMTDEVYYSVKDTVTISPTERYYLVRSCGNVARISRAIVAVMRKNMETKNIDMILYKELNGIKLSKPV
jgi:general secretion pathway protein K